VADLIRLDAPPLEADVALAHEATRALVSWNARAPRGSIELAASFPDGSRSPWLAFVRWSEGERSSQYGCAGGLELAVDTALATPPLRTLHVRSEVALDALWIATPTQPGGGDDATVNARPVELDVPAYSQYPPGHEHERGWCSPASLAMLLAYWGRPLAVPAVAAAVYDTAYGGAGNWAFNTAFAGALGFAAATAYLRGLGHALQFLAAGIPLAVSIAWPEGALPGAPLPASAGHLLVVRGLGADGTVLVNDPARRDVRGAYPAGAFERAWLGHGGVAYLIAPSERAAHLLELANQ